MSSGPLRSAGGEPGPGGELAQPLGPPLYRGRLAPSPTGALHLGTARTSLVAWLRARAARGSLILRVEDLDGPRVVPGAATALERDLRWLGLDWDEGPDVGGPFGPYRQSERFSHYEAALARLERRGLTFRCSCTRAELNAASAPHGDLGPRYPGTCRSAPRDPARPCSIRMRTSNMPAFDDVLFGAQPGGPEDDFVLKRADGLYAYQLAVVVDDIAMGVTEVVRGADLLSSTPRQLLLYEALGAAPPRFLHVPLVLDAAGVRLAKRHRSTGIAQHRDAGVTAAEVVGWLASSLGLAAEGERVLPVDLIERFDARVLSREPTRLPASASE